MHFKSCAQSNQLQLENVLALVTAEIQITACGIHCKVTDYGGALITNRELIASYVIIRLFHGEEVFGHNLSVNSKSQHPPWNCFKSSEKPCPRENFFCKSKAPRQKSTYPWEYLRRSSQHCLLICVEMSEFAEIKP